MINGIYKYFRAKYRVYGDIFKPRGAMKGKEIINIKGAYNVTWQSLNREKKHFIVEIQRSEREVLLWIKLFI